MYAVKASLEMSAGDSRSSRSQVRGGAVVLSMFDRTRGGAGRRHKERNFWIRKRGRGKGRGREGRVPREVQGIRGFWPERRV